MTTMGPWHEALVPFAPCYTTVALPARLHGTRRRRGHHVDV